MATNPIDNAYSGLMLLSQRCLNGANSLGASIPLLINTAANIGADRAALRTAENVYRAARGDLNPLFDTLGVAMADSRVFCTRARDVLKKWCGDRFNSTWIPTGFTSSTRIPATEGPLTTLVEDLASFFAAHTDHENPDLGVTAAAAGTLHGRLQAARSAIDNKKMDCESTKQVRDDKLAALRKRLSGLCKELSQRFDPLDARWRDFGFNLPGAPATPAVPRNVTVNNEMALKLLVTSDPSPNATGYRFYYQRPIIDPEPLLAGSAPEPLFIIEGLTAGQLYQVFVSATNEGAESELSAPAQAVVSAAAAA